MPELVIVRGLPGSGKSTLAKREYPNHVMYESDQYLTSVDGTYLWHPELHAAAKALVLKSADNALSKGYDVVVCGVFQEDTGAVVFERLADYHGATFKIKTVKTQFKNIHNVPMFVFNRMKAKYKERQS